FHLIFNYNIMNLNQEAIQIAESLNVPKWKEFSQIAKNLIAILIAGIPCPGAGSVAELIDKVGDHFLEPDLKDAVEKLAGLIIVLAPEVEKLPKLEEKVGALFIVLEQNQALLYKLDAICENFNKTALQHFHVYTDNSLQELVESTVKNMKVRIEAHNNGVNLLYRFKTEGGDVQFNSTGGSHQRVDQSVFEGKEGGFVSMDNLNASGPIRTSSDGKDSEIAFGTGSALESQKVGFLGFGRKKNDED
ncbi:MAG: hypothetical protein V1848_02985, partial [Candidatus Magasanikbacteria bacterium]